MIVNLQNKMNVVHGNLYIPDKAAIAEEHE